MFTRKLCKRVERTQNSEGGNILVADRLDNSLAGKWRRVITKTRFCDLLRITMFQPPFKGSSPTNYLHHDSDLTEIFCANLPLDTLRRARINFPCLKEHGLLLKSGPTLQSQLNVRALALEGLLPLTSKKREVVSLDYGRLAVSW